MERFIERQRPKRAKLDIWQEHLLLLAGRGASYREMATFVSERGTPCTGDEIHRFLNRKKRAPLLAAAHANSDAPALDASTQDATKASPKPVTRKPKVRQPAAAVPVTHPARPTAPAQRVSQMPVPAPAPPAGQPPEPGRLPKFVWPQPTSNDNQEW